MVDTIIVRPSGTLRMTNQNKDVARIVEIEEENVMEDTGEDRLTVRHGFSVPQKISAENTIAQSCNNIMGISEEDCQRIREMGSFVEQLKEQSAFNIRWREDAESDYLATRQRLSDYENMASAAVATANEAGQLSRSLLPKVTAMECQMSNMCTEFKQLLVHKSSSDSTLSVADLAVRTLAARLDNLGARDSDVGKPCSQD